MYLSGRSSAFYANCPMFVTKLYIAQIAVKRSHPLGNRPIALDRTLKLISVAPKRTHHLKLLRIPDSVYV